MLLMYADTTSCARATLLLSLVIFYFSTRVPIFFTLFCLVTIFLVMSSHLLSTHLCIGHQVLVHCRCPSLEFLLVFVLYLAFLQCVSYPADDVEGSGVRQCFFVSGFAGNVCKHCGVRSIEHSAGLFIQFPSFWPIHHYGTHSGLVEA